MRRSLAFLLVPLLAGCNLSLDREDVAAWANTGSALAVYTNIHQPVAVAVGEGSFVDPACPVVVDDGTTVTITGACTDSEGEPWDGEVVITRVGLPDEPRDLDLSFTGYGSGGDLTARTTGIARTRHLDGQAYTFEVDIVSEGGVSTDIEYSGTVVGDYGQPTLWNGSGTVVRTGLAPPTGTAMFETADQLLDDDLCSNAAASGKTTIELDNGHTVVVTYDGETDCDDEQAAKLEVDGKDRGLVEGVTCSVVDDRGRGSIAALGLLGLLGLRRRRSLGG